MQVNIGPPVMKTDARWLAGVLPSDWSQLQFIVTVGSIE